MTKAEHILPAEDKKKIHILFVISDLGMGGTEREAVLLLSRLSRDLFQIDLCLWRPEFHYPVPDDIPVHICAKNRPYHILRTIWQMKKLIDELKPSLIFSYLNYVNVVTGTALFFAAHKPKWICRYTTAALQQSMHGPIIWWTRLVLKQASCVLGISDGVCREIINKLHCPQEIVKFVANSFDLPYIRELASQPLPITKKSDVFTIVNVGRFHPLKNHHLLLKTLSNFKGKPVELWLVGDGPLNESLKKLAHGLGIESQIQWIGAQKNPFPYYKHADCFILSSNYEGLPSVVVESILCGLPVISTRCKFGPEELIIDGENGLLVPVGNKAALTKAIKTVIDDRDKLDRMKQSCLSQDLFRFDEENVYKSYGKLFKNTNFL